MAGEGLYDMYSYLHRTFVGWMKAIDWRLESLPVTCCTDLLITYLEVPQSDR